MLKRVAAPQDAKQKTVLEQKRPPFVLHTEASRHAAAWAAGCLCQISRALPRLNPWLVGMAWCSESAASGHCAKPGPSHTCQRLEAAETLGTPVPSGCRPIRAGSRAAKGVAGWSHGAALPAYSRAAASLACGDCGGGGGGGRGGGGTEMRARRTNCCWNGGSSA